MAAPINTYDSPTDLNLGQVPTELDEALYRDLLDIHNALEILLTASDDGDKLFQEFIDKFRNFSLPPVTSDYTVLLTDGAVRVDASAGDITVTLPLGDSGVGYRYWIKRIDLVTASKVTLVGSDSELIDDRVDGIRISTKSSYTVKAHNTGYDII